MITPTNFNVSSAVSAAASLPNSDKNAEILAHFQGILTTLQTQPLRVSVSASKTSGDQSLVQQMRREGFIL